MKTKISYILLLALFIRLVSINQSFWLDEATTAVVIRDFNFSQILEFAKGDFHPPLYYIFAKYWTQIIGLNETVLRLLSVVFGLGTIYLVYKIGKQIKNSTVGVIAALLMSLSGLHIYYSQEARMYSMAAFFVTLSFYAYLEARKNKKYWYLFSVSIAFGILTDYLVILTIPVFLSDLMFNKNKKTNSTHIFYVIFPVFITLLLISPIFYEQLSSGLSVKGSNPLWWGALGSANLKNVVLIPVKFMIGRVSFPKIIYATVVLIFGSLYSYMIFIACKNIKKNRIIFYWLIIPVILGVAISFLVPVLTYFRFLFILPALFILLSNGIENLKEKHFIPVLFMIIILNIFVSTRYLFSNVFHREDWRGFVEYVENNKKENYKIIFVNNSQMEALNFYYPDGNYGVLEEGDLERSELWLMRYVSDIFDPNNEILHQIERSDYFKESEYNFRGVVVFRYEKQK